MKNTYLKEAMKQIPNPYLLVNFVSRRVRQLTAGHQPLTITTGIISPTDIALKELAEGKFTVEIIEDDIKEKKKK